MKKAFFRLLPVVLMTVLPAYADRIEFKYDTCGNCIQKVKTIVIGIRSQSARGLSPEADEQPSSVDTWGYGTTLYIYPNPTRGLLRLEFRGTPPAEVYRLRLSDMRGSVLQELESRAQSQALDMTAYPAGLYLLQIQYGQETKEWKIIKE